jgi:hypothetical protein
MLDKEASETPALLYRANWPTITFNVQDMSVAIVAAFLSAEGLYAFP